MFFEWYGTHLTPDSGHNGPRHVVLTIFRTPSSYVCGPQIYVSLPS